MTNIVETLLSRNLVDVFGEPDALKRRVAIAEIWTTNGVFAEPHGRHVGQEALSEAVGQLHKRFPGFVFTAIGSPQTFFDVGRLAWGHGPAGEPRKSQDWMSSPCMMGASRRSSRLSIHCRLSEGDEDDGVRAGWMDERGRRGPERRTYSRAPPARRSRCASWL